MIERSRLFCRKEMINSTIESTVSRMQTVIELGRILRDRKTMPVKVRIPHKESALPSMKKIPPRRISQMNNQDLTQV